MKPPHTQDFHVAIIGAGLAGLGLAMSLHSKGIPCAVYEAATKPTQVIRGSMNIAPNGQVALEAYGILPGLHRHSCPYEYASVRDSKGEVVSKILLGHKDYFKYDGMRIVRSQLVEILIVTAKERGIPVQRNKKFTRVVSESKVKGVQFEFEDGTSSSASLLVGADGIYSSLRKTMYPDVEPQYIGMVVVMGECAAEAASLTQDHNSMVLGGEIGSFLLGAHVPDRSDFMFAIQKNHPDLGREGWKQLGKDTKSMKEFLYADYDKWPVYCQHILDHSRDEALFLWPLMTLPDLPSWMSQGRRVLLIGDAAHAMPPSGGQGANQAFEDGRTLGLVLEKVQKGTKTLDSAIEFWQEMGKERIEDVLDMTMQWNKMRKPGQETAKTIGTGNSDHEGLEQMRGIYGGVPMQEHKIEAWAQSI